MLGYLTFVTCFTVCLYLLKLHSPPAAVFDQLITPLPVPRILPHEAAIGLQLFSDQYVSYLPHSGFHNQRIALENALIISSILNRTLLVPPIILGDPPPQYRPPLSLPVEITLSGKSGLENCVLVPEGTRLPKLCGHHVHMPWEWFVNLEHVTQQHGIKMLMRWDLSDAFLFRGLRLDPSDTYLLADNEKYQYRFFDSQTDKQPLGPRFKTRIDLPTLAARARAHRLLQFGSLFGTSRVRLSDPAHVALRRNVRCAMAFTNPDLLAVADSVRDSDELGGDSGYAAVHVRLGDGAFAEGETSAQNTRLIWWRLVRELGMNDGDALEIESRLLPTPPQLPQVQHPAASGTTDSQSTPLDQPSICQRRASHPLLSLPLYIATDAHNHPHLSIFTCTFSCVYFLSNFTEHFAKLDGLHVSSISDGKGPDIVHSPVSGMTPLAPFLPPFLDAIIAAKARFVVGTEGSTFSRFVEDVLWHAYHGWDIPVTKPSQKR